MKVLFCASEVEPFAKTGGLADVAGALPLALGRLGVEIMIVMPRYRGIPSQQKKIAENVSIHFIKHEVFFNRASLYGNKNGDYPDNLERFAFFSHAALLAAKKAKFKPDVVHVNDWQTALGPVFLKTKFLNDPFFQKTKSFLTIHNMAYQGIFPRRLYEVLELDPALFSMGGFEFYGRINLLKAGILFADALGTVSPAYAQEIQTKEFGFGLEKVVQRRASHFTGILNGIDTKVWNPKKDSWIEARYSDANLEGKALNKAALQRSLGLEIDPGIPFFGMVTRLAEQKGLEDFAEIADDFLSQKVQFVLLGDGDGVYHTTFRNIGARHPKNTSIHLGFNAKEAHQIYAGCDFLLMPSLFEPCGLGQLISLKYGTVPIVRQTGGLADTIIDCDADAENGNGLSFSGRFSKAFFQTLNRSIKVYKDKQRFRKLQKTGMRADFSWKHSAQAYKQLYQRLARS
ncbi:MAG: hypothetical protein AUJ71_03515 [Candidatus Omnitrophica bacterium CG1_02_49_16]|nr:MAG: hypothetical protein AUJ71_03515 [Candidatus Omnitrophica bacterium CG1_02_49_16]